MKCTAKIRKKGEERNPTRATKAERERERERFTPLPQRQKRGEDGGEGGEGGGGASTAIQKRGREGEGEGRLQAVVGLACLGAQTGGIWKWSGEASIISPGTIWAQVLVRRADSTAQPSRVFIRDSMAVRFLPLSLSSSPSTP